MNRFEVLTSNLLHSSSFRCRSFVPAVDVTNFFGGNLENLDFRVLQFCFA